MTFQELKDYFKTVQNILIDVNINLNNAEYLINMTDEKELSVRKMGFFEHYFISARFVVIVQLTKILDQNDNQKFNIPKFLNRLESTSIKNIPEDHITEDSDPKEKYFFENYDSHRDRLNNQIALSRDKILNKKPQITNLVKNRNQLFAHTDENPEINLTQWTELRELTDFSSKIFNDLYGIFFPEELEFKLTSPWHIKQIIRRISNNL